jgi:hypothetical protein
MKKVIASLMAFALVCCCAPFTGCAGEAQDEEELARKEKEALEQKTLKARQLKEEEARKTAEAAEEAKQAAAKAAAAKANPKQIDMAKGASLENICKECRGTGLLPILPYKPYVKIAGQPPPNQDYPALWKACPTCQKFLDSAAISDDMKARQEKAVAEHEKLEGSLGTKLTLLMTPYVSVHTDLPLDKVKRVGTSLETLADILQTKAKSTVMLPTRPDTHHILLFKSDKLYDKYVDLMTPPNPAMKKASGFHSRHHAVQKTTTAQDPPHWEESLAVYSMGCLLMKEATDEKQDKSKAWLVEGFAEYCENVTLKSNYIHTIYASNTPLKFGKDYNADVRSASGKGQLATWVKAFSFDLMNQKVNDYLTMYSMVMFLHMSDPVRFDRMTQYIALGDDSPVAIEKAYGKKIAELQAFWPQWIATTAK